MIVSVLTNPEHPRKLTVKNLRRLAKFMRVRRWWALRKAELVKEIVWKVDPWKDCGMC